MKDKLVLVFLMIATSAFSVYLYGNIAEGILFVDIPKINSVEAKMDPANLSNDSKHVDSTKAIGYLGTPKLLRLSRLEMTNTLEESRLTKKGWLAEKSKVNYYFISPSYSGRLGDMVLFDTSGSKELEALKISTSGDKISIVTDLKWTYNYRITKKSVLEKSKTYIPGTSQNSKLIFIHEIENGSYNLIIEAELLSVEEELL